MSQADHAKYDVVVIGAGAVGCAATRELAGRGFKVLLVERADIGSGTSSRSSRMLYSGLGYLAPKYPLWKMIFHPLDMWQRLKYTYHTMQCRAELVQDMPEHLTKHQFHYPFRKVDQYPPYLVDIGFRVVEALGGWKVPLNYQRQSRKKAEERSALVHELSDSASQVGMFEEYMYAWPERICVDTALDAEARGAEIRTYTEVIGLEKQQNGWQVNLKDNRPDSQDRATVKAQVVINAAGPWVDYVPDAGGSIKKRAIGIKGVNVMVRLPDAFKGMGLEAFSSKGEPFYVFPHLHLSREHVLHSWCGVRPTSTIDGKNTSLPIRLSEEPSQPNLLTLTGSTIMLHRHASRIIAKAVESRLGKRGQAPKGLIKKGYKEKSTTASEVSEMSVRQALLNEHVVHLTDLIRRRLPYGLDKDLGKNKAEELSNIAAEVLEWSEQRRLQELESFFMETDKIYSQAQTQA